MPDSLHDRVARAVSQFWRVREDQGGRQHATGRRDQGQRSVVTGGQQLNGFADLIRQLIVDTGIDSSHVYVGRGKTVLPGYFRATKDWDLVVVLKGKLLATIEFKSQIGPSFGNNFNNRTEEAVGSAHDLQIAYRDGALQRSPQPWLGYLMLLEKCPGLVRPVGVKEPHFPVLDELRDISYAQRYEALCLRLVRERLYTSACLLLADREAGSNGDFEEPNEELAFGRLAASLTGHIRGFTDYA